jgi:hypothetical protein
MISGPTARSAGSCANKHIHLPDGEAVRDHERLSLRELAGA